MNLNKVLFGVILLGLVCWIADAAFGVDFKLTLFIGLSAMLLAPLAEKYIGSKASE